MKAAANPLDCSRPGTALFWFLVGAGIAAAVVIGRSGGQWNALLRVGSQNPLYHQLERELGALPVTDGTGHDGQLYYLIARDPFARGATADALAQFDNNGPRYRYRRILFPLLAGGFGYFAPRTTLAGMVALLIVAMGLTSLALADLAFQLKLKGGAVFLATANVGAMLSLVLLTPDVLAMGLSLAGVAMALRRRVGLSAVALVLAVLTKEVHLITAWGVAAALWQHSDRRGAIALAAIPSVVVGVWHLFVTVWLPAGQGSAQNIGLPFVGIVDAVGIWARMQRNPVELALIVFSLFAVLLTVITQFVGRNRTLRWVAGLWLVLGACSSVLVWGVPNNAARGLAILWPMGILQWSEWRMLRRNTPAVPVARPAERPALPDAHLG